MFKSTLKAGVSSWSCGSSVVGSTPWATTTFPLGAAQARGANASTNAAAQIHAVHFRMPLPPLLPSSPHDATRPHARFPGGDSRL